MHGAAGDSSASASLLVRHPLPPEQQPLYRALNYTPSMGPASAHIVAQQFGNLGALMAAFLDPSQCARCAPSLLKRAGLERFEFSSHCTARSWGLQWLTCSP